MAEKTAPKPNMIGMTDFLFFFCGEKKPGDGEDSYAYALHERGALLGVFDGCGGSGAAVYEGLQNKTGAYLAARAASAAWLRWFEGLDFDGEISAEALKPMLLRDLRLCEERGGEGGDKLLGTMAKRFPTTAAAAVCRPCRGGVEALLQWAGDSRIYWLDGDGLAQLTEDDLGGIDAMQNLSEDAPLTNAINLSRDFQIHSASRVFRGPGLLFASSDGCFGYLSTPMEFEALLLCTLQQAATPAEWESLVKEAVGRISGDDYTLCGICLGFGSFEELRRRLRRRGDLLDRVYVNGLEACSREEKLQLWERYQENYYRFLCRD
jgi:serine/threonine protein phosphatase PrpC